MNGYIAQRRDRFYVVIYEGRDLARLSQFQAAGPAGDGRTRP